MLEQNHCDLSECRSTQADMFETIYASRENEARIENWPKADDGSFQFLDCLSSRKDHGNGNSNSTCSVQSVHCPCLVTREQMQNILSTSICSLLRP